MAPRKPTLKKPAPVKKTAAVKKTAGALKKASAGKAAVAKPAAKKGPAKKSAPALKPAAKKAAPAKAPATKPAAKSPAASKAMPKKPATASAVVAKAPAAKKIAAPRTPAKRTASGPSSTQAPVAPLDAQPQHDAASAAPGANKLELVPDSTQGDARGASSRGKYVYCIIRSSQPLRFGAIGLGPEAADVYTVIHEDLAAVVSDAPVGVLDPTRDNVLAHQQVNEIVMREHTVLPMSFGTVFKTRDDIIELLRSAYEAFGDVLVKMQNKFEFGLKVLWDRDAVIREMESEDEDLRRLKSEISTQKGSTYFARMQYGRMVDAALQQRSDRYVASIFEALRDVAVASRTNKPIGDKMIMNAAFLVSRDKEAAFDAKVKQIGQRLDKLTFKYTGPWPPYNFVNIRLKLERAGGGGGG